MKPELRELHKEILRREWIAPRSVKISDLDPWIQKTTALQIKLRHLCDSDDEMGPLEKTAYETLETYLNDLDRIQRNLDILSGEMSLGRYVERFGISILLADSASASNAASLWENWAGRESEKI